LDANVQTEIVHIGRRTKHPALDYIRTEKNISIPAFILTDPNGNFLIMPYSIRQENLNESLWQLIEEVISSPLRKQLLDLVTNTYGCVLLIEGKNKEKNELAGQIISAAINDIMQVMKLMPKPVKEPPQLIVLSEQAFTKERVLLWSLDTPEKVMEEPRLAILYGRGRRIGPVLKGTEITKDNIFGLLAIIGADCECGLDRSVMLGKMIPFRWEKKVRDVLAASLGFDVENPLVKSEMRQILSISPGISGNKNAKSPLSAYREGIIKFDHVVTVPTVSSDPFRAAGASTVETTVNPVLRIGLYTTGTLLLLTLIIAGLIYFKREKNG